MSGLHRTVKGQVVGIVEEVESQAEDDLDMLSVQCTLYNHGHVKNS